MQLKNGEMNMTITSKLVLMICLMMGTAMFINGLNELMSEVGFSHYEIDRIERDYFVVVQP